MHETLSYTIEQAKTQVEVFGSALDNVEAAGAVGDVLAGFTWDYYRACYRVAEHELDQFIAKRKPWSQFLEDHLKVAWDINQRELERGRPTDTKRQHVDAEIAVHLAKAKYTIIVKMPHDTEPSPTRRGKRTALVHGNKIKTGRFVRIAGDRVPVLRTVRKFHD